MATAKTGRDARRPRKFMTIALGTPLVSHQGTMLALSKLAFGNPMTRRIPATLSVIVLALMQQACSPAPSAEDAAADIISMVNSGDSRALWEMTSTRSQGLLSEELTGAQSSAAGREALKSYLGLSDSEIENLTAEDYFVHMMATDPDWGVQQLELVRVEVNGDIARIFWQAEEADGLNILVKEQGQWRFDYDF